MANKLTPDLRQAIRSEFIHGYTDEQGVRQYPSVDALAKRHGVARATLYRWVERLQLSEDSYVDAGRCHRGGSAHGA